MSSRRFARQARLSEVGSEGQARLESTRVVVTGGAPLAHETAALYLARAGVGARAGSADGEGASVVCRDHGLGLRRGPHEVAMGALTALVALRSILGLGALDAVVKKSSAR